MLRYVNIAFMIIGFCLTIPFWLIAGLFRPEHSYEIIRIYRFTVFSLMAATIAALTTKLIFTYKHILLKQAPEGET